MSHKLELSELGDLVLYEGQKRGNHYAYLACGGSDSYW